MSEETQEPVKRVLDEETKRKLMGFVPFSVNATAAYTPEEFKFIKEPQYRPIFILRPFSQAEVTQMRRNSSTYTAQSTQEEISVIADLNRELVRGCIKGWANLFDAGTGEEIVFKDDKDIFNSFPKWLTNAITDQIRRISGLSSVEDLGLK